MVISEWIKICGKNSNPNIKNILDYSSVFYETWARFHNLDSSKGMNDAKLLSIIGVKISNESGAKYTGYVFKEANWCGNGKFMYSENKLFESNHSIYEVALMCDIKLKQDGFDIRSLNYKLDGEYV
jgi:hypothetical protein